MKLTSDNIILSMLGKIGDIILLNFLIILCSLPIFTVGAAFTAGFVCLHQKENPAEHSSFSVFFRAFIRNFRQATIAWLLILAVVLLAAGDLFFAVFVSEGINLFYLIFGLFLLLAALGTAVWVFPLIAWYDNTLWQHFENALRLFLGRLPITLLLWLIWFLPVILSLFFEPFLVLFGWCTVVCLVALQVWGSCALVNSSVS